MKKLIYLVFVFILCGCGEPGEETYLDFPRDDIRTYYGFWASEPRGNFVGGYTDADGVMRLVWSDVSWSDYRDYIRELEFDIPDIDSQSSLSLSGNAEGEIFRYSNLLNGICSAKFIWASGLFYYEGDTLFTNNATLILNCAHLF